MCMQDSAKSYGYHSTWDTVPTAIDLKSNSNFLPLGSFILLKVIKDPKELMFLWVLAINIYNIRD